MQIKNKLVLIFSSLLAAAAVIFALGEFSGEKPVFSDGGEAARTITGLLGEMIGD